MKTNSPKTKTETPSPQGKVPTTATERHFSDIDKNLELFRMIIQMAIIHQVPPERLARIDYLAVHRYIGRMRAEIQRLKQEGNKPTK